MQTVRWRPSEGKFYTVTEKLGIERTIESSCLRGQRTAPETKN
jgi:hypothetical protein